MEGVDRARLLRMRQQIDSMLGGGNEISSFSQSGPQPGMGRGMAATMGGGEKMGVGFRGQQVTSNFDEDYDQRNAASFGYKFGSGFAQEESTEQVPVGLGGGYGADDDESQQASNSEEMASHFPKRGGRGGRSAGGRFMGRGGAFGSKRPYNMGMMGDGTGGFEDPGFGPMNYGTGFMPPPMGGPMGGFRGGRGGWGGPPPSFRGGGPPSQRTWSRQWDSGEPKIRKIDPVQFELDNALAHGLNIGAFDVMCGKIVSKGLAQSLLNATSYCAVLHNISRCFDVEPEYAFSDPEESEYTTTKQVFSCTMTFKDDSNYLFRSRGSNKKEAKQRVALKCLEYMQRDTRVDILDHLENVKLVLPEEPSKFQAPARPQFNDAMSELNYNLQWLEMKPAESDYQFNQKSKMFSSLLTVTCPDDETLHATGKGFSKKAARQLAAKELVKQLWAKYPGNSGEEGEEEGSMEVEEGEVNSSQSQEEKQDTSTEAEPVEEKTEEQKKEEAKAAKLAILKPRGGRGGGRGGGDRLTFYSHLVRKSDHHTRRNQRMESEGAMGRGFIDGDNYTAFNG